MARLNGKGPEEKGTGTGRGLGKCIVKNDEIKRSTQLGIGMGKRRKAGMPE